MRFKLWYALMVLAFLLAACASRESDSSTPKPGDPRALPLPTGSPASINSYTPRKGDETMTRGEVYIDSLAIVQENGFPPQYSLQVSGSLPTPCHALRATVDVPTQDSRIDVQLYSLVNPDALCTQMLEPFEASIPLGSYVRGSYTLFVNGSAVGKITP